MDQLQELYFSSKGEWRTWLINNHCQTAPVWLVYFKTTSGKIAISYNDSVEQALCYGWIDGIIKSIDEESYKRKFMPRSNFFNWSPSNRQRVEKLIKTGEMTESGLNSIGNYYSTHQLIWPEIKEPELDLFSETLMKMLQSEPEAFHFFNKLSKSHQKRYIGWVMQAKKEETQIRRMEEAIKLLHNSTKNLLK